MSETANPASRPDAGTEALVITAPDGAAYAVPLAALEQWRLPDDVAAQLQEQHEVAGYIIIVGGHQALGVTQLAAFSPRTAFDAGGGVGFYSLRR
jgi:hypothetical protein